MHCTLRVLHPAQGAGICPLQPSRPAGSVTVCWSHCCCFLAWQLQLWVSPVKLVVGKGNLLSQIFRLLGMHGRFGSSGHHHQQPWLLGNSSGSATAAAAAKEQAAAAAEGGAAVQGVEVWSGPLRVAMEAPGRFRTDRVDMIVGERYWLHSPGQFCNHIKHLVRTLLVKRGPLVAVSSWLAGWQCLCQHGDSLKTQQFHYNAASCSGGAE